MTDAVLKDPEKPFDAGDPASVKERGRYLKLAAADRARMIKSIMSLREGRKWIWEILEACHVFRTSFATNALVMANNEGERNIGLKIFADITTEDNFALYLQMLQESKDG